eukprot:10441852-Prorocentrum_lima.AAC.1
MLRDSGPAGAFSWFLLDGDRVPARQATANPVASAAQMECDSGGSTAKAGKAAAASKKRKVE